MTGSVEKYWGGQWIFHGEQSQQPAWKAVHIACDVGNRVHTRNDSDEDVRGNAYKQTIAWKALPWSFITQANKRQLELYARAECQGKAFQAIVYLLFSSEGVAPGYQHRQADVYCLPGKFSPLHYYLAFPIFPLDISTEPNDWR